MQGPEGSSARYDTSSPAQPATAPMPAASADIAGSPATQKRALAAGSIISPTAISVPSAWKPLTRLATTSTSSSACTRAPGPPTLRRKPGSKLSTTSGRQAAASSSSVRLEMVAIISSAASSTANTLPNSSRIRSTWLPRSDTSSTPSASAIR